MKLSKIADKECLLELRRMSKIFNSVVKVEKIYAKRLQSKNKKINTMVKKSIPCVSKLFGEKRPRKVAIRKTKSVSEK